MMRMKREIRLKFILIIFIASISFVLSILCDDFWDTYLFWFTYPFLVLFLFTDYYYNLNLASKYLKRIDNKLFKKVSRKYFFNIELIDWYFIKSKEISQINKIELFIFKVKLSFKLLIITFVLLILNITFYMIYTLSVHSYPPQIPHVCH